MSMSAVENFLTDKSDPPSLWRRAA